MMDITEHIQTILQFISYFNIDNAPKLIKKHKDISLDNVEVFIDKDKILLHHVLKIENENADGVQTYLNNIHSIMNGYPKWKWKFDDYGHCTIVNGVSYTDSFGIEIEISI